MLETFKSWPLAIQIVVLAGIVVFTLTGIVLRIKELLNQMPPQKNGESTCTPPTV